MECQVVVIRVENPIKIKALTDAEKVFEALKEDPFLKGGNYENGKLKSCKCKKHSNVSPTWAGGGIQCCMYTNTSPITFLSSQGANVHKSISPR